VGATGKHLFGVIRRDAQPTNNRNSHRRPGRSTSGLMPLIDRTRMALDNPTLGSSPWCQVDTTEGDAFSRSVP
jgi:hypothetical protein